MLWRTYVPIANRAPEAKSPKPTGALLFSLFKERAAPCLVASGHIHPEHSHQKLLRFMTRPSAGIM
jgi:hypothetical protein